MGQIRRGAKSARWRDPWAGLDVCRGGRPLRPGPLEDAVGCLSLGRVKSEDSNSTRTLLFLAARRTESALLAARAFPGLIRTSTDVPQAPEVLKTRETLTSRTVANILAEPRPLAENTAREDGHAAETGRSVVCRDMDPPVRQKCM